jgi:ABC-type uncharacterized transport system involved in gliding motility auxiliary subunit
VRSRVRAASLSGAVIAAVLAVLVGANVLASKSMETWDMTSARNNTLTPQSVLAAKRLTSNLDVIGLFHPGSGSGQPEAEALVALYAAQSPRVKYRSADPETDATDRHRYGILQDNTVVIQYEGKTELLLPGSQTESEFTAAIGKLESGRVPIVCWSVGDGERQLNDTNDNTGYSAAAGLLENNSFTHKEVLLASVASIPADCDELVILDATNALPDKTVAVVDAYLAGGGSLLIVAEPWAKDPKATASLGAVLKPYGLGFSGALVVEGDPSRSASGDPTVPAVIDYGRSPITADIQGAVSFFPQTTAITGTPVPGATVVRMASTSTAAYAIPGIRSSLVREAGDVSGPFTMMETVEQAVGAAKTRIVIVGTQSFADNRTLASDDANVELTLGSFQWLAGQDSLVAVPAKPARALPLALAQQDQSLVIFITIVLMPGLIAIGGIAVWWRRRVSS